MHPILFKKLNHAAAKGHLEELNKLITEVPNAIKELIVIDHYSVFRYAATNGHLDFLKRLFAFAPKQVQAMSNWSYYPVLKSAISNGHLHILEYLFDFAPDQIQEMIGYGNYEVFRIAASQGNLAALAFLVRHLPPESIPKMLSAGNYLAYSSALINGHLEVLNFILELAPNQIQTMISANEFYEFEYALERNHLPVINRILSFANVFAYAEMHIAEHGALIEEFIHTNLDQLRDGVRSFVDANPHGIFDITDTEQKQLYFYMIRHLIRQNNPQILDEIRFLLEIPSLKNIIHLPNNELLRLALSLSNQQAIEILIQIPAVRELAEANNYYRSEQRGELDLSVLAQDRESSMQALTTGEQRRLAAAIEHYKPLMSSLGTQEIIQTLRDTLKQRYLDEPASIQTEDGRNITLPLAWDDFQELIQIFSEQTKEKALQTYYQHPDHTAFRYLMKPNPWINQHSPYVNRNHEGAWSSFQENQNLISLHFLAAKDEKTPAIDGYTIETRLEQFIKEIALIARAHNWDCRRINPSTFQIEEYDDLQSDYPSCYSGVKRRLFQSVQGHHLFKLLSLDDIKQELRDFVRTYFIEQVDKNNDEELLEAYADPYSNAEVLRSLTIPEKSRQQFLTYLSEKYGVQFDSDQTLKSYIDKRFQEADSDSHAARFGGETNLLDILQQKIASKITVTTRPQLNELRLKRIHFFNSKKEENDIKTSPTKQALNP